MGILKFNYHSLIINFTFTRHSSRVYKGLKIILARILFIIALVFISLPATADEVAREYKIKAAFIYNFTKFIVWPQQDTNSNDGYFNVCILGDNRISAASSTIQGKLVHGKILQIKYIKNVEKKAECEIIFFAISNTERLKKALESMKGMSILSVGDSRDFIDNGGIIGLFENNNKVRFDINQLAANESGLKISSQLLELANRVIN